MALIKCKECGKQISSRAEKCPNCGCPIKEPPKLICPECGKEVSENDTKCTNCGCPSNMFKTAPISSLNNESSPIVQQKKDEDSKKQLSLYLWWASLVVLIIAVVIGLSRFGGIQGNNKTFTANGVSFTMVYVQGGTFTMGEQGSDAGPEKPAHSVTLSSYYIGETEVTQDLWLAVMGSAPSYNGGWTSEYGVGNNYPAYRVSWEDCQTFISRLNSLTGQHFRLPTEAQWEYAARGGDKSRGYKYSGSNDIGSVAWNCNNSDRKTHPVKTKSPNELGIYDMSGNVEEWCQDRYGSYSSGAQTNPTGTHRRNADQRVIRGGSWDSGTEWCRSSTRYIGTPSICGYDFGLRLAL